MKIIVHDYSGHLLGVELSRSLAGRGHDTMHVFSSSFLTPKGALEKRESDPDTFQVRPIQLREKVDKENLFKRRAQEMEHGQGVSKVIAEFKPDLVISGNTPLDAQKLMQAQCEALGIPMVFWVQDLNGLAATNLLGKKLPLAGTIIGRYYVEMEKRLLRRSAQIVAISDDFKSIITNWGLPADKVTVIENWAPLADMPLRPKVNPWSQSKGYAETFNFVYSGTLGMKHNPELLVRLAQKFEDRPEVRIIVISQGSGRNWLEEQKAQGRAKNMDLYDYQPIEQLPNALGSADVVVAILEPEAGPLSVPSKVMSYMCTGRPMLLAIPPENLASRNVAKNETGLVSPPLDIDSFLKNAETLYADGDARSLMGANARQYAETNFEIGKITDQFEPVFQRATGRATRILN